MRAGREDRCRCCLKRGSVAEVPMWGSVRWCRACALSKGGLVGRRAVAVQDVERSGGFTPEALKSLAAGGIMDANALFLPAGRISKQEAEARERANVERLA